MRSTLPRLARRRGAASPLLAASLVALALAPSVLRADTATFNGVDLTYAKSNVPDIDQKRDFDTNNGIMGLPNKGKMYCVPTSAMNWIAYIANHGYPFIPPGVGNWQVSPPNFLDAYNKMTLNLFTLGILMGTDPVNGTGGGNAQFATQAWLDSYLPGFFAVSLDYAQGGYSPTFQNMSFLAMAGALVMPTIGWYTNPDVPGIIHVRSGGHVVSLAGAKVSGFPVPVDQTMEIRDPAAPSDGMLTTQSTFSTEAYQVKRELAWYGYKDTSNVIHITLRTQDKVLSYGSGYLDGVMAIWPKFGLLPYDSSIVLNFPVKFRDVEKPALQIFPSATGGKILDMALNPIRTQHPYLIDGSDAVWLFDAVTGQSSRLAAVEHPRRLVLGGHELRPYVLLDKALVCLAGDGSVRKRLPLPAPLDAIAFDDRANRLIGVSRAANKLFVCDAELRGVTGAALPRGVLERTDGGRIAIAVNPTDGSLFLLGAKLFRVRTGERGAVTAEPVKLPGVTRTPLGLFVDERGSLFISDGGRLAAFDARGQRLERSPFAGQPGGGIIQILRPFSNFDPATMRGPSYRNVAPDDLPRPAVTVKPDGTTRTDGPR
jgi:hypothetical protein